MSATGNQQTLALTRDPATGFVTGTALGSVSTSQAHSGFGELSAIEATFQSSVNFSQTLERDALGRITQLDETIGTTQTTTLYTYDAAGRLGWSRGGVEEARHLLAQPLLLVLLARRLTSARRGH